jgi:tetratricopeptide (TPR) repeat protein
MKYSPVIFVLFFLNNCFSQNLFEKGREEYRNGNSEKAIELLTKAIENKIEISNSLMYRGAAETSLKFYSEAIRDLDASKKMDSISTYRLYFFYGRYYLLKEDFDKALINFNKSISLNKNHAASYNGRSSIKIVMNDFKGAIEDEDIAIHLDPNDELFYDTRGFAKLMLEKYNEAIEDFDSSIKIIPQAKEFAHRGLAYFKLNNFSKAINDFSKAIELNPLTADVIYLRGIAYKLSNQNFLACKDFNKCIEMGFPKEKLQDYLKETCN